MRKLLFLVILSVAGGAVTGFLPATKPAYAAPNFLVVPFIYDNWGVTQTYWSNAQGNHRAWDLSAPATFNGYTEIVAAAGGIAHTGYTGCAWGNGWGRWVTIDHLNGYTTTYAHLADFRVADGAQVSAGQVIGIMGDCGQATGPHLHFEVHQGNVAVNPGDPRGCDASSSTNLWAACHPRAGLPSWIYFPGDLDYWSGVNIYDLSILLSHWGRTNDAADLNGDRSVNIFDLSIQLTNWGRAWWGRGTLFASSPSTALLTSLAGPTMAVGTPSMVGGQVQVPINASGSGFDPYTSFNIHLRWDQTIFKFGNASTSGGLFESASTCPNVIVDPDGGGASLACAFSDAHGTTSTGLLASFTLIPVATGCSRLQLMTFGPPDGGDELSGTATVNPAPDITAQSNQYMAGSVDVSGQVCTSPTCVNHDSDSLCDDVDPDDDNDGLPDAYESANSCLNQIIDDASADPDHDGLSNVEEYRLGTDPCVSDTDGDGLLDGADNCTLASNHDQADTDRDGLGDACDACTSDLSNDEDNDGICVGTGFLPSKTGDHDNCPTIYNPDQTDTDANGIGDACEEAAAPVGGIAELPDTADPALKSAEPSRGSAPPYAAIAGAGVAGLIALGAGGWCARRRWVD